MIVRVLAVRLVSPCKTSLKYRERNRCVVTYVVNGPNCIKMVISIYHLEEKEKEEMDQKVEKTKKKRKKKSDHT